MTVYEKAQLMYHAEYAKDLFQGYLTGIAFVGQPGYVRNVGLN